MNVRATSLAAMPVCQSAEGGTAIVFSFTDMAGKEHAFACAPAAVSEIIMKFVAAADNAARQRGELPDAPGATGVRALVPEKMGVAADESGGSVILRLHASETSTLDYALAPGAANELAGKLKAEAAKLQRVLKKKLH